MIKDTLESGQKSDVAITSKFGNWPSKITSDLIVSDSISIDEARLTSQALYYIERRPQEKGRCVIVRHADGQSSDLLPAPYSARSRVHEYGGGGYCVVENCVADNKGRVEAGDSGEDSTREHIFFVNDSDQDIYLIDDDQVNRITDAPDSRFADFVYDSNQHRLISICETHKDDQVINSIVSIDINSGTITTIERGHDFYASPRLNHASTQLCWQAWDHPNMPWDGNKLWLCALEADGSMKDKQHIAGGDNISVFQPSWSPDDVLHYIADDDGWWHLYRFAQNSATKLTEGNKEFGLPQWVFAQSSYTFIDATRLLCSYRSQESSSNRTELAVLSLTDKELTSLDTEWHSFDSIASSTNPRAASINAQQNNIGFIAASGNRFPQLVAARLSEGQLKTEVIKSSSEMPLSDDYYSAAQAICFKNRHQQTVYANYYPPTNPDIESQIIKRTGENAYPPLIVICHGGPTGQSSTALDPKKQFWTSRGFALLDVNYSGSTGYGKEYRQRLDGQWGKLDVEDCCDAALYAVAEGLADKDKLIIRGSSAGGFTVLAALTFEQVFSAGASYYGISDLSSLADDTHKFEAHYTDRLVGPYPEAEAIYRERSPIHHTDRMNCPVIFFQGDEDKVVPREQAEMMYQALSKKGLPVAAQYYASEQHGFRQAQTIKQSLENELRFYQLVFKLKPEQAIDFIGDIATDNLDIRS